MAPMALLELSDVTGDARYRDAAIAGLAWSRGHNELGVDLLDADHHFAHRSIRRKSPWNRAAQAANIAGSVVAGRPVRVSGSALEVNRHVSSVPPRLDARGVGRSRARGIRCCRWLTPVTPRRRRETRSSCSVWPSTRSRWSRPRTRCARCSRRVVRINTSCSTRRRSWRWTRDPELRRVVQSCDLVNADGMAVVWASRILGVPLPERVAGIDLFERLVQLAYEDGRSVYFLGATDEVRRGRGRDLRQALSRDCAWPATATDTGKTTPRSSPKCVRPRRTCSSSRSRARARSSGSNAHLKELNVPFVMGVGGSFDVVAGKVSRAPRWMQRVGLEWSWRLIQEPRKMWRRYLFTNTTFIRITARAWWESRR